VYENTQAADKGVEEGWRITHVGRDPVEEEWSNGKGPRSVLKMVEVKTGLGMPYTISFEIPEYESGDSDNSLPPIINELPLIGADDDSDNISSSGPGPNNGNAIPGNIVRADIAGTYEAPDGRGSVYVTVDMETDGYYDITFQKLRLENTTVAMEVQDDFTVDFSINTDDDYEAIKGAIIKNGNVVTIQWDELPENRAFDEVLVVREEADGVLVYGNWEKVP